MAYSPTVVRIATTTSVFQSGLATRLNLAFGLFQAGLNPPLTPPYTLTWAALGSGAAMDAAKAGDADLVISHDRYGELDFLNGVPHYALNRTHWSYNYFVIVGRTGGPIPVGTLQSCFNAIVNAAGTSPKPPVAQSNALYFVSRGSTGRSGTWIREQQIWMKLSIALPGPGNVLSPPYPNPPVPPQPNLGMYATLEATAILASTGVNAYTMTDIGTWYEFQINSSNLAANLTMLTSPNDQPPPTNPPAYPARDPWASNQYVAMMVNQAALASGTQINTPGAMAFLAWLLTTQGANNAKDIVNGIIGGNRGFYYNADENEHFPDDSSLLKPVPPLS